MRLVLGAWLAWLYALETYDGMRYEYVIIINYNIIITTSQQ